MSVSSIGNLNIYDPNQNIGGNVFQSFGFGGNPDSNDVVNHEDLIMYCNLRAFTRPRSYILNSNSDGAKLQSVASARINFMKPNPEKTKFSTDWTDIDASGRPNSDEMLGINTIQITYDTSYIPRVTITMTDVRGQALNEDPADSPYGSFFNFPYPMFVLEVKGYYGKAVKYLLHLLKYSSKFNYESGNFEITCEFVGFTYALLSDLNVQYGIVAAQMTINGKLGKDILIEKYEQQKKKYPNLSSDIERIIKSDVYTLVGLINKSKDLNTFVESLSQDGENFKLKAALDNFIDLIQNLFDDINNGNSIRNNTFNERVLKINNDTLFINFPEYKKRLECNVLAPNDTNDLSNDNKNKFNNYVNTSKKIIGDEINNLLKNIDTEVKDGLTEQLGFTPTIQNIMLIICNNYELFLDLLTNTTKSAANIRKNKLKNVINNNPNRLENKNLELVYPWPALYDDNYNICYFNDIQTLNINDYPENEFVESYLSATLQTNKLLENTASTLNVSETILNQVQYNPIHTFQYSDNNPRFNEKLNNYLIEIVEHALLLSTNTWGDNGISKQIQDFGKVDADNIFNVLGDNIGNDLSTLNNNLNWLNDKENNNLGNNPIGILQTITGNKSPISSNNNPFNVIKDKFKYIKNDVYDFLTDIVETDGITILKEKYNTFNSFRFVPEVKDNLLSGSNYGLDNKSVNIENNGFISYDKTKKIEFPSNISLASIFKPFMVKFENSNSLIFDPNLLSDNNKLLFSLKSFLLEIQNNTVPKLNFWDYLFNLGFIKLFEEGFKVTDVLYNTPGIIDTNKDFILFNGIHKTKMIGLLNYLFLNDEDFLNPDLFDDYTVLKKYRYYFPLTTQGFKNSYPDDITAYNFNVNLFLSVYKELIERLVSTINKNNTEITDLDLYLTVVDGNIFTINSDGQPSEYSNQIKYKKEYSEIYGIIKEFFDTDIQMVCYSNKVNDVYKDPLKYWTNSGNWGENFLINTKEITYDNKKYGRFNSGYIINQYLIGFKKRISEIKESFDNNTYARTSDKTAGVKTSGDIKKSLYQTFKNINDKWVIDDGENNYYTWSLSGDVDDNEKPLLNNDRTFLFDHFFFVDRVNKNIGPDLLLDFRILNDYYDKVNSKNSLYSVISELAKQNEMIFHPLTSYISFGGLTNGNTPVDNLFKPITTLDFESSTPAFIMQYVGKNASYQYDNQNHIPDVVKIDFTDTPRFISPSKSPFGDVNDENIVNKPVAFLVDVGIKNQNMFKGISLDQAEFRETNESITVWDQLTSQNQNRSIQTIGNNIYPILSRRSYTCKVESLGNMMIQPTMYFYLRYVPLFSGLYLITKVSHSIQPNNVVTNFEGVRMSSFNFPLVSQFISTLSKEILEKGSVKNSNITVIENVNFWNNLTESSNSGDIIMKDRIITFYNNIKNRVKSKETQAALIAIAYKETGMIPRLESTYKGTTRHSTFKSFKALETYAIEGSNNTEVSTFINELKKKDTTFFNFVYGTGKKAKDLGNNPNTAKLNPIVIDGITVYDDVNGDGYKYRGRGFIQITGKGNYEMAKKDSGVDVVTFPEKLNEVETASLAMIGYYKRLSKGNVKESTNSDNPYYKTYSGKDIDSYDDYWTAYNTLFTMTAGPGRSLQTHLNNSIIKSGYNKGYSILQSIYNAIKEDKIK